jgi:hypothetical protein
MTAGAKLFAQDKCGAAGLTSHDWVPIHCVDSLFTSKPQTMALVESISSGSEACYELSPDARTSHSISDDSLHSISK